MAQVETAQGWRKAAAALSSLAFYAGIVLVLYVGSAVAGFVSSSARHYTLFTLGVVLISGLIAMRDAIYTRLGIKLGEEGYVEVDPDAAGAKASPMFWLKLTASVLGVVLAVVGAFYIFINANRLELTAPFFENADMIMGGVLTVGILILTWIHWGWILTVIIGLAIVYFFYGHLIENPLLNHPPYEPNFVMNYIGVGTTQGFYWFAQTAADDIFFLVIYACVLFGLGMLRMILEVGKAMGNRIKGGAAGPAIVGSGLVAATMGTAVSNVVLCGRFTIPLMTKHGYSPAMAGALEATASTSGQIMPPVLGLAAFIIAGFLGIAYIEVVKAAVIPGVLYMTGVAIGVFVYAHKYDLPKLKEVVDNRVIWRLLPTFVISFVVVITMLLNYYSPSLSGLAGILTALALSLTQGSYRPSFKAFADALAEGIVLVALLSLLLIAIGPLGQAFMTTNLSGRLGTWLITVLPDSAILLLIGAAILSLVLGTGLPTPVAYLMVALAAVPFLIQLGVKPLQAHYFAFYWAVYSALTPPVAVASLAAAKISGAGFWETSVHAMKLAATTFIIPFAFVFNDELMQFPNFSIAMVAAILEVLLIQWTSSVWLYGYFLRHLSTLERTGFMLTTFVGYAAMINRSPNTFTYILLGMTALMMVIIWLRRSQTVAIPGRTGPKIQATRADV
ncbi:MAG: TRAP transporter permease [Pseudomonadota bacterium]